MCKLSETKLEKIREWLHRPNEDDIYLVGQNEEDELSIVVHDWEAIARLNFAINKGFNPNWPEQREIYLRAMWLYRQVRKDRFSTALSDMKLHYASPSSGVYGERLLQYDPRIASGGKYWGDDRSWLSRHPERLHGVITLDDVANVYFSDEYDSCRRCDTIIRTSPDSYGWQPDHHVFASEGLVCGDCIREDEDLKDDYLAEKTYTTNWYGADRSGSIVSVNTWIADPLEYGWARVNDDSFRTGMRHGDTDDPRRMIDVMLGEDIDVMFDVHPEQFGANFWILVQEKDLDRAMDLLDEYSTKLDYDPAVEIDKVLRGQESDHIKKETYLVKQEDLIDSDNWIETMREKGKKVE